MSWLAAACGSCFLFVLVATATFVPLQSRAGVEYLFVWPASSTLLPIWIAGAAALVSSYFAIRVLSRRHGDAGDAKSGRWLMPMTAMSVVALGVLPAAPGVGERGAVLGYFFYDLRWWWLGVCVALSVWRADVMLGAPIARACRIVSRWPREARLLFFDAALFASVIAWAIVTSPITRFDSGLVGDEPKYIRYCELWYEGGGLDISRGKLVSDQPVDAAPALLQNGEWFLAAAGEDLRGLVEDVQNFGRHPLSFRWNRVRAGNSFVTGRFGGIYQIHEPGTSAFLFPGYFIDRYLLSTGSSSDGKFPSDLVMTNVMMLLVYGLAAVFLFRLLARALGSESLAWIWAAIAMMTMPVTAFAFQFYPELPALLIIVAVSGYVLFTDSAGGASGALAGGVAGALVWLHPRFLLTAFCLAAFVIAFGRGKARSSFLASFAAVLLSVMAYDYHATGSWLPTALWDATGEGVTFSKAGFVENIVGYGFDRFWGLLPHSLILAAALPGLCVLWRTSRRHAAFVAILAMTLVGTASGHTLNAAGTTPGRLVLAVVPLLIWPVAVLVRRFWSSPTVRAATVTGVVLSLDAALAYNWSHYKPYGLLSDTSVSGWKLNLAFPNTREAWSGSRASLVVLLCEMTVVASLTLLAFLRSGTSSAKAAPRTWPVPMAATAVIVVLAGGFTAATAASYWTSGRFLVDDRIAREQAAHALVAWERCRICFSSARGQIDWARLEPNAARGARVTVDTDRLVATVRVDVDGDGRNLAFGRMRAEFGDGEETAWTGIVASDRIVHRYASPGTFHLKVWFRLPDGATRLSADDIEVK
jgi:hypothetical protein